MELTNPQEIEVRVEARFRIFLILWGAILMSAGLLATVGVVVGTKGTPNPTLTYILLFIGAMMIGLSTVMKRNMVRTAIDNNDANGLQVAHILALALCESVAVLGLINLETTGSPLSWLLFAMA